MGEHLVRGQVDLREREPGVAWKAGMPGVVIFLGDTLIRMVPPWRGENYSKDRPFRLTILVLGESSYDKTRQNRGMPLPPDWNKRIIKCAYRGERDNTITRAARGFYGEWRSFPQRWEFWQASAFANFVQHDMGSHGQRPDDPHWKVGEKAFQEYLVELRPQFILALGSELWSHLPHLYRKEHSPVRLGAETRPCYLYPNDAGYAFVFGIPHPSARSWSYRRWTHCCPWRQNSSVCIAPFRVLSGSWTHS